MSALPAPSADMAVEVKKEREDAPSAQPASKEAAWLEKCGAIKPSEKGYVDVTFSGVTTRYLYGGTLGTFSSGACCEACASVREENFTLRASKSADLGHESLYIDAGGVTFYDAEGRVWSGGKHKLGETKYGERIEGTAALPLRLRSAGELKRVPMTGPEEVLTLKFSLPRTP